ncbi:PREDICTED: uncharacterized protein LOC108769154 [Trachymyrmex cornetzi]|uniref:uncharacterized protein LOC108769154 n=1 Tax=Trachymyrmex cornetzi TaxID=471704 RepID=UPI00084EED2E|nr:PREDICTED: uncharacterized protein LOC108769154 [Trachymyrmex cornetzi]
MGKSKKRSREKIDEENVARWRKKLRKYQDRLDRGVKVNPERGQTESTEREFDKENQPANINEQVKEAEIMPEVPEKSDLDQSILDLLGEDPTISKAIEVKLHASLVSHWEGLLKEGLSNEDKEKLINKYRRSELMKAPKLNPEVANALAEPAVKRDKHFVDYQNAIGSAIASLGLAMSQILEPSEDGIDELMVIERLSDAARLLNDLHYRQSICRRAFILPGIPRGFKTAIENTKPDSFLFGKELGEKIKEAGVIEKVTLESPSGVQTLRSTETLSRHQEETLSASPAESPKLVTQQIISQVGFEEQPLVSKIAGRLKGYVDNWKKITRDRFILACIEGYKIPFKTKVTQNVIFKEPARTAKESTDLKESIESLLLKGAIVACKPIAGQFLSSYFLVQKPNGDYRFILNLKKLNEFVEIEHFKMEDLRTAVKLVLPGFFMASIDLEDAYMLVAVDYDSRKYLRFQFEGTLYEFTCLPFDLSSRFVINIRKSVLDPRTCRFLGFEIDSKSYTVCLPNDKKRRLSSLIDKFMQMRSCKIRESANLIGTLVAASPGVNYGWIYLKTLEREKILALIYNQNDYDQKMEISEQVRTDLNWWKRNIQQSVSNIRSPNFDWTIYTDASMTGWGAVLGSKKIHGFWNKTEREQHINFLELKAIQLALKNFEIELGNSNVLLKVDNTTAISYINKMGGVKYQKFNHLAKEIWKWAETRDIWLFAVHIPSEKNVIADGHSRIKNIDTEWEIAEFAFEK